jgi:hypothetical protein
VICGLLWVLQLPPSTNKTDRHDITEILLKVALNTIALTLTTYLRKLLFIRWVDTSEEVTGYPSAGAQESTPCFSEMHVAQSFDFCVVFYEPVFVYLSSFFGHRIVCFRFLVTSSVFGFWLPLLFSSYLGWLNELGRWI